MMKSMPFSQAIASVAAVLLLSSCASTYHQKAGPAYSALRRADYAAAIEKIEEVQPAPRDLLLHLMDKGMIYHAAGQYEESNKFLTQAEELSDMLFSKSVSREVAATLWSEEATEYAGDKHERALVPLLRMLNYIMMDKWNEALVEVRRLELVVERNYENKEDYKNWLGIYMSALVWEALGHLNDAYIDYQKLAKQKLELPYYGEDIKALGKKLGLPSSNGGNLKLPQMTSADYRKNKGQLVVIVESGLAPYYVSDTVSLGLYTFSVPLAFGYPVPFHSADVKVDGVLVGETYPFYNIFYDIMQALKVRAKRSMIRKMIKGAVQTGLYTAGSEMMNQKKVEEQAVGLGLVLMALTMSAAEKADERSWRSLPAQFQIGRFYLSPGNHEVEVVPRGITAPRKFSVVISEKSPSAILFNFQATGLEVGSVQAVRSAAADEYRFEENELIAALEKDRTNPTLKARLARIRIMQGDYQVEHLLHESLYGDPKNEETILLLIIAKMVKGDYSGVQALSQRGVEVGGSYKSDFEKYGKAASAMLGGQAEFNLEEKSSDADALKVAFDDFVAGLIYEKRGNYEQAAASYANAYERGLKGKPVAERLVNAYGKTSDDFRKSPQGEKIAEEFVDAYLSSESQ